MKTTALTTMLLCAVLWIAPTAFGQAADAAADDKLIEAQADDLFRAMSDLLASQQKFTVEATITQDQVFSNGQKVQLESYRRIAVSRPDSVAVSGSGDSDSWNVKYHAGQFTLLDETTGEYAQMQVPAEIDGMLDHLVAELGLVVPLADVLVSDPYGSAMGGTQVGYYVGLHHVDGQSCHHLAFRAGGIDWQVWIAAEGEPVLRRLVITSAMANGQPQWAATFDNWDFNPAFDGGTFTFEPGADMVKVDAEDLLSRATQRPANPTSGE